MAVSSAASAGSVAPEAAPALAAVEAASESVAAAAAAARRRTTCMRAASRWCTCTARTRHARSMHTACTRHAHIMHLPRPPSSIVPECHLHRLPDAASDAVDIACLDVDRHGRRAQRAVHELIDVRCAVLVPPSVVQRHAARTVVGEAGMRAGTWGKLPCAPGRAYVSQEAGTRTLYVEHGCGTACMCMHMSTQASPPHGAPTVDGTGEDARAVGP